MLKSLPGFDLFRIVLDSAADAMGMQVPLNSLDLSHVSILYTQGEMAAITPIYVSAMLSALGILLGGATFLVQDMNELTGYGKQCGRVSQWHSKSYPTSAKDPC